MENSANTPEHSEKPTQIARDTLKAAADIALAESMKGSLSVDHPWDRGYRAGASAVWAKLRDLHAATKDPDHG